jgi:hypothetical protein
MAGSATRCPYKNNNILQLGTILNNENNETGVFKCFFQIFGMAGK